MLLLIGSFFNIHKHNHFDVVSLESDGQYTKKKEK